uniref:Ubiquitin-like protease family profile domain-containing protein n=1 Tax=Oryza meridionalis TaxID=40149 RepID=A0A0E0DPR0_9ORYZ
MGRCELDPDQKQFIIDNGFECFLSLSNFKVHSRLAEWIMQKMNPEICEFRFRGKVIVFDKLLVQKITGLNDGDLPVKLSGANSEVVKEIRTLYHPYFVSNRLGTGMCEKLLLSLHDEEKFLRTFILYLLATILCHATGNYVNLDYYDWCTHVANCLMREIRKYQGFSTEQRDSIFQIGECLPLLVIAYMDHLQMPTTGLHLRIIDYSTPRFCHVTDEDFEYVAVVDRCRMNLGYVTYGSRLFCPWNEIPYLAHVHAVVGRSEAENAGVARVEDVPIGAGQDGVGIGAGVAQDGVAQDSASLNEWIRLSASSSQGTTFPTSLKSIIEKHSAMWQDEFVSALDNFKRDMIDLHAKRTCDMISDISKVLADSNTAVGISEAVSNPPSTEGAAEAVSKPSSTEGAAEATVVDGPSKEASGGSVQASGGSVPSSPAVDDYILAYRSDISNLDDACDAPSFSLFNESDPEFISTQDLAAKMLSFRQWMQGYLLHHLSHLFLQGHLLQLLHPLQRHLLQPPPFTHCNKNINFSSTLSSSSKCNIPSYIFTATCYKLATSSSGPNTHEKKNRKKRAQKGDCDVEAKKLKTTSEIDDVYTRFVIDSVPNRSRKADAKELPTPFLRIGAFHVSLEYFREAMKPRGELNNEDKLICNPEKFVSESCVKWVKSINKEQKLPKLDLFSFNICYFFLASHPIKLFFPIVRDKHWVLTCINLLWEQINYFDSIKRDDISQWFILSQNLFFFSQCRCAVRVTNFTKVAVDAKIPIKDISKFQTCSPPRLRYIENWDGKNLQAFNEIDMPNYRKFVTHMMISSHLAKVDHDQLQANWCRGQSCH